MPIGMSCRRPPGADSDPGPAPVGGIGIKRGEIHPRGQ
jgi:hypothetical protein